MESEADKQAIGSGDAKPESKQQLEQLRGLLGECMLEDLGSGLAIIHLPFFG